MRTPSIVRICVALATLMSWGMTRDAAACPPSYEPDPGPNLLQVLGAGTAVLLVVAAMYILGRLAFRRPTIVP